MKICSRCGVELEDEMNTCPLCDKIISRVDDEPEHTTKSKYPENNDKKHLMQRILWQITMVLLVSGILSTLVINLSTIGTITWAIYPITICLMLLSYASLMALWKRKLILQLSGGWFISALLLVMVHWYTRSEWPLSLALPVVSSINIMGIFLAFFLNKLKTKGLNVLAIVFVSLAVLSLMIESVISWYVNGSVILGWSVIVAACLFPVTAAILFMYFRTRNNSELQKIFHT